jgi:phytoene dehydrogenase-like protein
MFSNFTNKGVYTFWGGTDLLIGKMTEELTRNRVDIFKLRKVEKILLEGPRVIGIRLNGVDVKCGAVLSNVHILNTVENLVDREHFSPELL